MSDRRLQLLLAVLSGVIFAVAVVGLVTVDDESDEDVAVGNGTTTTEVGDGAPDITAAPTTEPDDVETTVTSSPTVTAAQASTSTTAAPATTPAGASGTTATTAAGTGSSNGLGESGTGELANGPTAIADTGAPAILLPAGLAALGGSAVLRRLRRRTED